MSEWLTIGQVIDRMQIGDIAKSHLMITYNDGYYYIKRESTGFYVWNGHSENDLNNYHPLKLEECYFRYKWRIIPKYVSFVEAMEAYEEGKRVYFHGTNEVMLDEGIELPPRGVSIASSPVGKWDFYTLYVGKWTIED
jgi:hypothetical protein